MDSQPKRKILVVDDDPSVLAFVTTVAESMDYEVLKAKDGLDAMIAYGSCPGIDAMVTDVRMPGVNGFQLAHEVKARNPSIPILFISGFADDLDIKSEMKEIAGARFLAKPFTPMQLGAELLMLFASHAES
jgi:CheY-like chemotaxis protein